jgi:hypothetical protein
VGHISDGCCRSESPTISTSGGLFQPTSSPTANGTRRCKVRRYLGPRTSEALLPHGHVLTCTLCCPGRSLDRLRRRCRDGRATWLRWRVNVRRHWPLPAPAAAARVRCAPSCDANRAHAHMHLTTTDPHELDPPAARCASLAATPLMAHASSLAAPPQAARKSAAQGGRHSSRSGCCSYSRCTRTRTRAGSCGRHRCFPLGVRARAWRRPQLAARKALARAAIGLRLAPSQHGPTGDADGGDGTALGPPRAVPMIAGSWIVPLVNDAHGRDGRFDTVTLCGEHAHCHWAMDSHPAVQN